MSASLVRKGLMLVDSEYSNNNSKKHVQGKKASMLKPKSHKLIDKLYQKGKGCKVNLLPSQKKQTVYEIRKTIKSKEQILKENLEKLKLIKSASKVGLDKDTVNLIIERAVTKRPVKKPSKKTKKEKKTAFTEEDFKKFEEEYFDE